MSEVEGSISKIPNDGFQNEKQLGTWLKTQPTQVAYAIGLRGVLRALSTYELVNTRDASTRQLLSIFRYLEAARFAVVWPSRSKRWAGPKPSPGLAFNISSARMGSRTALSASARAFARMLIRPVASTVAGATSTIFYAARSVQKFDPLAEIIFWQQVTRDAEMCDDPSKTVGPAGPELLIDLPLWFASPQHTNLSSPPEQVLNAWRNLKQRLLSSDQNWDVWTDWYDEILHGKLGNSREEEIELARIDTITDESWRAGPAAVNAQIQAIIQQFENKKLNADRTITDEPKAELSIEQGTGPVFGNQAGALATVSQSPAATEIEDEVQQKLFERINRQVQKLLDQTGNALAQHPFLSDTIEDYHKATKFSDISQIDVVDLWMAGAGLIQQTRAFASIDPSKQVTEMLEPEQLALLAEITRLHGAFVMGFEIGRSLAERSQIPLLSTEEFRCLLEHERAIVRWLLESSKFELSDQARVLFERLDRILYSTTEGVDELVVAGYPTIRNLIIFTSQALQFAIKGAGGLALVGLPVHLAIGGLLEFLQTNTTAISGFATSVPELNAFLEFHLKRLEKDHKKNQRAKKRTSDAKDGSS